MYLFFQPYFGEQINIVLPYKVWESEGKTEPNFFRGGLCHRIVSEGDKLKY